MPFINVRVSQPQRKFEEIDALILANVFPFLNWKENGGNAKYIRILPNLRPARSLLDTGPTQSKSPTEYFALRCRRVGLPYSEIGTWLDYCLDTRVVEHTDGIIREINTEYDRLLRTDRRKPVYEFEGIYRSLFIIRYCGMNKRTCPSPAHEIAKI